MDLQSYVESAGPGWQALRGCIEQLKGPAVSSSSPEGSAGSQRAVHACSSSSVPQQRRMQRRHWQGAVHAGFQQCKLHLWLSSARQAAGDPQ